jgi:hypothetical protein
MNTMHTCPNGHQWDAAGEQSHCPICGAKLSEFAAARARAGDAETVTHASADSSQPDERFENAMLSYLKAKEAGSPPDREAFLRRYPGLTAELEGFLADEERIAPALAPLRALGARAALAPPTEPLGDYEVLDQIAHGGMGVVYRARQKRPGRIVALKMILAGAHASQVDLERFRTEAQAMARLQHPNIVQVFEVGEHNGQPYFSMEFCPGGSLAKKLAGTPLPPNEAAALIETLARAMHAAHAKGVIHRDLKPGNVLLAEDGTPKVTDFGLARKIDEPGMTITGAIMGTPSYMAPEQAQGKVKELARACDVYALGAILYECVTGRPPFRAATKLETMMQVISDEPVPPRQLNAGVPKDLETVCLKCLHKEPGKRYTSAQALAEDLRRWQNGEPIHALPAGRVERTAKWAMRNKGLSAGLTAATLGVAAAAIALVVGSVVSVYFGIDAAEEAKQARKARDDLKAANDDLLKSQDKIEGTLAQTWLSPLATTRGPLTDAEFDALAQLASFRNERVAVRFVDEGLRDPKRVLKLKARAEYALHAAVGLNRQKRDEVEGLLLKAICAPEIPLNSRADVAELALVLGDLSPSSVSVMGPVLARVLARVTDARYRQSLARGIPVMAAHMEREEAVRMCAEAAAVLAGDMKNTSDPLTLCSLGQDLSAIAAWMEHKEAIRLRTEVAAILVGRMSKTHDHPPMRAHLARSLLAIAARLDPKTATAALLQVMKSEWHPQVLWPLEEGLSAAAARLDANEAAEAATAIANDVIQRTSNIDYALPIRVRSISVLAARMKAEEATRLWSEVATAAVQNMTLAQSKLGQSDAHRAWEAVLSAVAKEMEPREAARVYGEVAKRIMKEMKEVLLLPASEEHLRTSVWTLAWKLSDAAAWMEPKEATASSTEAAIALAQAMCETADLDEKSSPYPEQGKLSRLALTLRKVAGRLEHAGAAEAATNLARAIRKHADNRTRNTDTTLSQLAAGLSAVAARLDTKEAAPLCTEAAIALALAMTKDSKKQPRQLDRLALSLSELAPQIEAAEATRLCSAAATALLQAMNDELDVFKRGSLVRSLSALAPRMRSEVAAEATTALVLAMRKVSKSSGGGRFDLAECLSTIAAKAKMEPKQQALIRAQAAATVAQAMIEAPDDWGLAGSVVALAPWMEPKAAAQAAIIIAQAMPKSGLGSYYEHLRKVQNPLRQGVPVQRLALEDLEKGLAAVAPRLEPKTATEVAMMLAQAMPKARNPVAVARSLSTVAARMKPEDAAPVYAKAATSIVQALTNQPKEEAEPTFRQKDLLEGLSLLVAHMEHEEAARLSGEATKAVAKAMSQETHRYENFDVVKEGLWAVAPRLKTAAAAESAAALVQAMRETADPIIKTPGPADSVTLSRVADKTSGLAQSVAVVATRIPREDAARFCTEAAMILAHLRGKERDPWKWNAARNLARLDEGLSALAVWTPPDAVFALAGAMSKAADPTVRQALEGAIVALLGPAPRTDHARTIAAAVTTPADGGLFPGALWLLTLAVEQAAESPPCHFSAQELVDLLKHPFCVGTTRRAILDQLENRYSTTFADHWAFVRFAQEQNLGLDFID